MRHTNITPEEMDETDLQERLDKFWKLIENDYEEEWRVEYDGTMVLNVTEELLARVLRENHIPARLYFGTVEEHNPENERWEWLNFPEDLIGLYSIKGVYLPNQRYVSGLRTYFFVQEGF